MHFGTVTQERDKVHAAFWIKQRVCCTPVYAATALRIIRSIIQANTPHLEVKPTGKRMFSITSKRFVPVYTGSTSAAAMSAFLSTHHHASVKRTGKNTYDQAAK